MAFLVGARPSRLFYSCCLANVCSVSRAKGGAALAVCSRQWRALAEEVGL